MGRVVNFDFQDNFIRSLADFVDNEYISRGRDLGRIAFVFGGRRPELFLKKELAVRKKKGFVSPAFFAMDEFIDHIISEYEDFYRLNDLEAAYILYDLARTHSPQILKGKDSFAAFLPWSREILAFIEQLDLEDIGEEPLKGVELNAAIGFDVPESINELLSKVISLRKNFHRELKKRKTYTRGLRYLMAAELISKQDFSGFDEIVFCNLFYLHESEKNVIKSLYDRDRAILVFQGASDNFSVLKKIEADFDCELKCSRPKTPEYKLSLYSCFDAQSQAATARHILESLKDHDETVIVLPRPERVITLLSQITSKEENFNVSMGYPLKRTAIFSLFSAIFKAQKSKKDDELYYSPDYLGLLTHPLVKNFKLMSDPASTRILVHKIEEMLVGVEKSDIGGSIFVALSQIESLKELYKKAALLQDHVQGEDLSSALEESLLKLHKLLFYSWEQVTCFSDFAVKITDFTDFLLKNSFLGNYPLNIKMSARLLEIARLMENSGFSREKFSREDIFKIFLDALSNELVSFSGSPLKGLQILGMFETRSLNFKNVIILDANESVLPNLKVYEPLIPRDVMLSLGLNRLEKEEEIQRYQFDRLISHAENVFLLFEEGRDKEKSRFIEDLIWKKQKEKSSLEVVDIPRVGFKVEVLPKKSLIKKDRCTIDYLKMFDYSVTNINTYLKCPLRFYYRYVLNLEEKLDLLEEPGGRQIGNFIHSLLEDAFKKFLSKKPVIDREFKKYFFSLFELRFEEAFRKTMKSDSFLLEEIMKFRLTRFLEEEEKRQVSRVLMLEAKFKEKIALPSGEFNFVLKVDRIDCLEDKSLLIIDYKTGGTEIKPKAVDKIREYGFKREALKDTVGSFQLPLYLYFVRRKQSGKPVINAALYNLRSGQMENFLKPGDFSDIENIENVFIQALDSLISEIIDPQVDFSGDSLDCRYCQNCPFFYLCR